MSDTRPDSLAAKNPELLDEWDYKKNKSIEPTLLSAGSNAKVWWKCNKGHEWQAIISNRTRLKSGCPYCSGRLVIAGENDLATKYPEIADEWDYDLNDNLTPATVKYGSSKKAWWKCNLCGYEWSALIKNRTIHGQGCPKCGKKKLSVSMSERAVEKGGSLLDNNPFLASEWNEKNAFSPKEISAGSNKKVWWKCKICGYEWQAVIASRNSGVGCPNCAKRVQTSFPEQAIFFYVKREYPSAVNGYREIFDNSMELDVFIPELRIGIEYDGKTWHKGKHNDEKEHQKYLTCKSNNIYLIRVREAESANKEPIADKVIIVNESRYSNEGLSSAINELKELVPLAQAIDVDKDKDLIRESYYSAVQSKSLEECYPDISKEWNREKNGQITPRMVYAVSGDIVWWKCNKGHEWQASIANRVRGRKCPFCGGKQVLDGYNDLKTAMPKIADEWNYSKNGIMTPSDVTVGSNKKVWWKCNKGHEWETTVSSRTGGGTNCPYCANQKVLAGYNDLETINPNLAKQWDYQKNYPLRPSDVLFRSPQKVWWKCPKGHSWIIGIKTRVAGNGCPVCANKVIVAGENDLASLFPNLADEWNYDKNDIKPTEVSIGSARKVWWKCGKGHEYQAVISNRTSKKTGCPYCSGRYGKAGQLDYIVDWNTQK